MLTQFGQPDIALLWIARLVAVGVVIDSLEWLAVWREWRADGTFSWRWLRTRHALLRQAALAPLFGFPGVLGLLLVRGGSALWLLPAPQAAGSSTALTLLVLTSLALHLRNFPFGIDGHHRMTLVICGALWLQHLALTSLPVQMATLWFIALQGVLSYTTSGWAKLGNRGWRQGKGLLRAFNTPRVGAPPAVAVFLAQHKPVAWTANWGAIVMECMFPLALVAPPPVAWLFLGWGVLFHVTNAVVLGFNTFVWAWLATYPAILYVVYNR